MKLAHRRSSIGLLFRDAEIGKTRHGQQLLRRIGVNSIGLVDAATGKHVRTGHERDVVVASEQQHFEARLPRSQHDHR